MTQPDESNSLRVPITTYPDGPLVSVPIMNEPTISELTASLADQLDKAGTLSAILIGKSPEGSVFNEVLRLIHEAEELLDMQTDAEYDERDGHA